MLSETDLATWAARIESEYREMPGLLLTKPQIQRLWGLDSDTCDTVVGMLVARHVLVKTGQAYAGADRHVSRRSQPLRRSTRKNAAMDIRHFRHYKAVVRTGMAVLAVLVLVAASTWHGRSGVMQASSPAVTESQTVLNRTRPGDRDSYADVVRVVAPAVVTVRTEGTVRTSWSIPNDDLLRRFFGEQYGTTPIRRRHSDSAASDRASLSLLTDSSSQIIMSLTAPTSFALTWSTAALSRQRWSGRMHQAISRC
jgi:hypothetical protein